MLADSPISGEMGTIQYRFHEGSVQIPRTWTDETLTVLKAPEFEGHNLVVSRQPMPSGVEPARHMEEQRQVIADTLDEFREIGRDELTVAGRPTTFMEYMWRSPEGVMFQANAMQTVGENLLSFTFTSGRPLTPAQHADIRQILASFVPAPELPVRPPR